jgi:hypothetical protein
MMAWIEELAPRLWYTAMVSAITLTLRVLGYPLLRPQHRTVVSLAAGHRAATRAQVSFS